MVNRICKLVLYFSEHREPRYLFQSPFEFLELSDGPARLEPRTSRAIAPLHYQLNLPVSRAPNNSHISVFLRDVNVTLMSGSKELQRFDNTVGTGPCYDIGNQPDVKIKAYVAMSLKFARMNFRIRYIADSKQGMSKN